MSSSSRKRRLSEDAKDDGSSQESDAKRANLDSALLSLSDEILIEILKGVTTSDLLALSTTCFRLNNLIRDKQFWVETDFTAFPLSVQQITRNLKYLHAETRSLKIRGLTSLHPHDKWKNATLTVHFLKQLAETCPNLEHLTVYEGYIDMSKVQIIHFPTTLKSLVFHRCEASQTLQSQFRPTSFFSKVDAHLKALEELTMEECSWFHTHDLIAFSKIPKLRLLSLRGCSSLKECVPYGSIATRFGFKALEVLDIRNTPVSDSDIQCFNMSNNLKQLLMECPENLRNQEEGNGAGTGEPTPGPSNEPPQPAEFGFDVAAANDEQNPRQVINVQFRHVHAGEGGDPAPAVAAAAAPAGGGGQEAEQPAEGAREASAEEQQQQQRRQAEEQNRIEIHNAEGEGNEREAVINAGNNNIRINVRNQNVHGRNVIHIVVRNNHTCNPERVRQVAEQRAAEREAAAAAAAVPGPSAEGQQQNREENSPPPAEAEGQGQAEVPAPAPAAPAPAQEPAQHFIMIRNYPGQNDAAQRAEEAANPVQRIVGFLQFERNYMLSFNPPPISLVSDRGICSFGQSRNDIQQGMVWIRAEYRNPDTFMERLSVRHYRLVTDVSLRHLISCAPNLKFLDVTGTSVTESGVANFRAAKPDCELMSSFD